MMHLAITDQALTAAQPVLDAGHLPLVEINMETGDVMGVTDATSTAGDPTLRLAEMLLGRRLIAAGRGKIVVLGYRSELDQLMLREVDVIGTQELARV